MWARAGGALLADDLAAIVATARQPRRSGRGVGSPEAAERHGRVYVAIAGLAFHGGLRRSEISAVRADDVEPAAGLPGAARVTIRRSKANQDGAAGDVRIVKNGPAAALLELAADVEPDARIIPLSGHQVARRLEAAGRAAGIDRRLTGHSGRVGLASELVARGASTADVMLAGGWKPPGWWRTTARARRPNAAPSPACSDLPSQVERPARPARWRWTFDVGDQRQPALA